MLKNFRKISEDQEIEQEERELKREYFVFVPLLLVIVGFIGFAVTRPQTKAVVELVQTQGNSGYWIVYDNGDVESYGTAAPVEEFEFAKDVRIVAAQPAANGFWTVTNRGRVYAHAGAEYSGAIDVGYISDDVAELIPAPNGRAYRIVTQDGPIYDFNVNPLPGARNFNKPVAAAAPTASGEGFWLIQPSGEIAVFGDASNFSSIDLAGEKVVDAAPYQGGLIVLTNKGRLVILGDGQDYGDLSGESLSSPVVDIDALDDGSGYRITSMDGTVTSFGSAQTL